MESTTMTPARCGSKANAHKRDDMLRTGARSRHDSGYVEIRVKAIVDAAQGPKRPLDNHFESKEGFTNKVVDIYFKRGYGERLAPLTDARMPPLVRLHVYFDDRIRSFRAGGYLRVCLTGNLSLKVADHSALILIRKQLAIYFTTWAALFENNIAEAQASGVSAPDCKHRYWRSSF
ncbi:TetR/AcrR family transcriptional regulator [Burkholderia sp. Ac-20384]|uniref:TetR/AcrR family transcriptional regulator n=1 Tax=Burkholderia sp. Ac-20384 TaxID=2703902 RepID=UPI001F120732|nr:TetR/AcrR family transcriptional regulator [Burkholderia sp. Ac-20384]